MTSIGGRLFWMELRRSTALFAIPVLIGLAWLAWYLFQQDEQHVSAHWPDASEDIGLAAIFLGPAAGGLAAWVASRERRSGLGDLLSTTPKPAFTREFTLFSATTFWIVAAYAAAGTYLGISTALKATWGGPVPSPILIGFLAITVQAAIGFAAGSFSASLVQSRLIAALVPVVLFLAELVPVLIQGGEEQIGPNMTADTFPYENLSAVSAIQSLGGSIYWSTPTDIAWGAAAWLGGFGGLALGLILLRHRPIFGAAWGLVTAAIVAIGFGWIQLVPAPVAGRDIPSSHAIAYEPVCEQRSILICLHPANESFLDLTAGQIDEVVRPIAGVTGAPLRAEQIPESQGGDLFLFESDDTDVIPAVPAYPGANPQTVATVAAVGAVRGHADDPFAVTPAQGAIAIWLMRQAGWDGLGDVVRVALTGSLPGQPGAIMPKDDYDRAMVDVELAAERFAVLAPAEQRKWLEANLTSLRAGTIQLEDLP